MSFSNLEKAFSAAKINSQPWFAKTSSRSFEAEVEDLLQNYSWPTPKIENWKYTNLSKLSKIDFWPSEQAPPKVLPKNWSDFLGRDFDSSFVFWNGQFSPELSKLSESKQFSLSQIRKGDQFSQLQSDSEIEKINQLLLNDLFRIEVKKSQKIEKTIAILFLNSTAQKRPQIHSSRIQLVMNEFAEASILEIHAGLTEVADQVENHLCEVILKESAHLEHNFVNVTSVGSTNFFIKKYDQAKASVLKTFHIDVGGDVSRTETYVNLNETTAEAFVNGLYLNNLKQHTDHQGVIRHVAPETLSHQIFKGILADQSKAVFNAKVRIEQTAPKSNAEQLNKNLLMSDKAEIDSLPRLEIFNDDVKATHGSASGQIDQDQIFYLVSRAISRQQAVQMLVEGYAFEMLSGLSALSAAKIGPLISEKLALFKAQT